MALLRPTRPRVATAALSTVAALTAGWIVLREVRAGGPDLRLRVLADDVRPTARAAPRGQDPLPGDPRAWPYYLDRERAHRIFLSADARREYDPWTNFRDRGGFAYTREWPEHPEGAWTATTNSLGLREDGELADPPAEIRVLVAGDSHTNGACNDDESFPALLERRLAEDLHGSTVEVLNAGTGGYTFHNYAGTLLRFRSFRPQVFVVAVFGGNDFYEAAYLRHELAGTARPPWDPAELAKRDRAVEIDPRVMGQGLASEHYFGLHPDEAAGALTASVGVVRQMQATCVELDAELVVVFIPSPTSLPWPRPKPEVAEVWAALGLDAAGGDTARRLEDAFLRRLSRRGVRTVDMRPSFEAEPSPPYWRRDHHVNLVGHERIADALAPIVLDRVRARAADSAPDHGEPALGAQEGGRGPRSGAAR